MKDTIAQHGVGITHHFGGGTYAKEAIIPAGVVLSQHVHPHEHLSILAFGRAIVQAGGDVRTVTGPACLVIPAGVAHSVSAVTDVAWYCIHATDDTDQDTVDATILTGGDSHE